ncbi:MAG: NAD(P)/FAD-dependent oxidoreductase [Candidatus Marinimicrobia bacterium]|nr:NAD(P)/FAD-dependent oxidoreductase [Candidatus Neomarinimicrobiota bacterium]
MKSKWDVIVVGGGPGGLFAAWEAAKAGKSVLLCERKREMGVPVRCGEAVGEVDFTKYISMEERWIGAKVKTFILVLPNGKEVKLKNDMYTGYILNRDLFEYDLATKASDAGVKIVMKANVTDLIHDENGSVKGIRVNEMGESHEYFASVVIAADGVESRIARKMGINTTLKPDDIEPCVQATVSNANLNENALYLYIGVCYAPGGYAWVFPKANNCANIGLGINGKYASTEKHSKDYLDEFLEKFFPHASIQRYVSGGVPVTTNLKTLAKENMLIVGDAGRMVNPMNGGGITHAITSGIQAGQAAAEACTDPGKIKKIFNKYQKDIHKQFGKNHESQYRIKEVVYQLSDEEYDQIGEEILKLDISKRTFLRVFTQVVKSRPEFLIDVVRAYAGI